MTLTRLLLLLALSWPAFGQTTFNPPNAPASNAAGFSGSLDATDEWLEIIVGGYSSVGVQLSGTWGGTISFQCTLNGTSWTALDFQPSSGTTLVTSSTSNGTWSTPSGGCTRIRFYGTSITSGTAIISTRVSTSSASRGKGGGGAGDIEGVTAGTNLNGGGTSGTVTLNVDNPVVADLTGNVTGNVSGSSGSTTGNAATATALAADPADCSADNFATGINASGTLACNTLAYIVGSVNLGAATSLILPNAAGAAPTADADFRFNTTPDRPVWGCGGITCTGVATEDTIDFTTYADGSTVTAVSGAPVETPITDSNATGEALQFDVLTGFSKITGIVQNTLTLTGGAGIAAIGDLSANRTVATASGEADFLASGALTCGAATQGKVQVHTTPLQYCDTAVTPVLQYAAYGASDGDALAGDSILSFFPAFTTAQLATELSDEDYEPGDEVSTEATLDFVALIDDEDTPLAFQRTLNFEGAGVTCADDVDQTTCTIAGGGSNAIIRVPLINWATTPDATGRAFFENYTTKATNDIFKHLVLTLNNPGAGESHGIYGTFDIPNACTASEVVRILWTSTAITGVANFAFDYRAIGGDDTESLDQATFQEQIDIEDTAPSATDERMNITGALTGTNLAAGDTVEFFFYRQDETGVDTLAAAVTIHGLFFECTEE